jgi:hypothetical protein
MEANRTYFPWHPFQLWLREGIFAGFILNKLMIASWPQEKRPFAPMVFPEEVELLGKIFYWARAHGLEKVPFELLSALSPGSDYPALSDQDVRSLWRAVTEYGVSNERYHGLHAQLRDHLTAAPDLDSAIRDGMDALWRSIGPALDPDRGNIERAIEKAG